MHNKLDAVIRLPVTVFKSDPQNGPLAEWHEIWIAKDRANGLFVLCDRHAWWDNLNKRPEFEVPILSEPFKTPSDANKALGERVEFLYEQGWTHHFTTVYDPTTGRGISTKVER